MNKEQEEEFEEIWDECWNDEIMEKKSKVFINKLLKEEREEIQRDINSVIGMLNGSTDREEIKNYIVEYLKK